MIAVIGSVAATVLIGRMRAALAAMAPVKVEPVKVESGVRASVPAAMPVENRG
jgi:hypothetical protein